jgi:hypothetical protein
MMTLGVAVLVISLLEELVRVLRGQKPTYQLRAESARDPDDA